MARLLSRAEARRRCAVVLAAMFATAILHSGSAAAADFVIKAGLIPTNEIHHEFARAFKPRVEEASKGRIEVQIYPGAQLGNIQQMVEGLQLGTIEMAILPPAFYKGADPRFQVADVPGLFDDIPHISRALSDPEFRDPFLSMAADKGIIGVALFDYGPSAYASMQPIRTLADFKGKKIRVLATDVERGIMDEFGATGIPMDMVQVIPALQRGQLEGIRSTSVVLAALKFYDVTKYITLVEDTHIPDAAMMSKRFYDKLPPDLQKIVMDTGRGLERYMEDVVNRFDRRAARLWQEKGGEVIRLSNKERNEFMERTAKIGDKIMGGDPQLAPMYNTLKQSAARHRLSEFERNLGPGM